MNSAIMKNQSNTPSCDPSADGRCVFWNNPMVALAQFWERGHHIEPKLLSEDYCDKLVAVAASRPNAKDGTFNPIPMPHLDHTGFLAMMRYRPIVEIVEQLVGGRASGLGGEYFYMPPGTRGFAGHQDNYYVQAPPDSFVSVWTALCDVGPENGGLVFYPGTQKLGILEVRQIREPVGSGQNPRARAVEAIFPAEYRPVDMRMQKGSVVFFHSLLVHASEGNSTSDRFRHSFLATYIKCGEPFRRGFIQERTEVELYAA